MAQGLISIAVGAAVAILAAVVLYGFLLATTWSSIHSGDRTAGPGVALTLLSLGATAAPPALGFLAGWATYRLMGSKTGPRD